MLKNTRPEPAPPFVLQDSDAPLLEKIPTAFAIPLRMAHTGMGYPAIAAELQIPLNTVKTRVHRARLYVRKLRAEKTISGSQ